MSLPPIRSLRLKLVLCLVPVVILGVGVMTWLAVSRATDAQTKSAKSGLLAQAQKEAAAFDAQAAAAAAVAKTVARTYVFADDRGEVSEALRRIIAANPQLAGTYVGFEPNGLGTDADHVGEVGDMGKGRFGPYWNRLSGKLAVEPLVDADTSDYYTIAKKTKRDVVVEPYVYGGALMTSYISPILRDGAFVGIGGVDVVLDKLNRDIAKVKVAKTGYAMVFSRGGLLVAGPDKKMLGKNLGAELAKKDPSVRKITALVSAGKPGVRRSKDPKTGAGQFIAWAPVKTGGWSVMLVAPEGEILAEAHALRTSLLIAGLVLVLLVACAIVLVASRLTRPVQGFVARLRSLTDADVADLRGGMEAMAAGDLTVEVVPTTEPAHDTAQDEIGVASRTLDELVESTRASVAAYEGTRAELGRMIGGVTAGAGRVSRASAEMAATSEEAGRAVGEIAHAVGDVAMGAEKQVRMVESARGLTEEVGAQVQQSAATAQETAEAADRARGVARDGVLAAAQVAEAMDAVRDSSDAVRDVMDGLAGKSAQIGGIVETITGIAEQTNLLALNAAIEAARAGDQGRGFAVVADEVRKLAEESQSSAASIATLITEIQHETKRAVDVVAAGAQRTSEGAGTVDEARAAFETIGVAVDEVSERIAAIAALAAEVAEGTERVQAEVVEIAAVAEQSSASSEEVSASTEQTSASTQEVAASAQELARTADELEQLVGQFRVTA